MISKKDINKGDYILITWYDAIGSINDDTNEGCLALSISGGWFINFNEEDGMEYILTAPTYYPKEDSYTGYDVIPLLLIKDIEVVKRTTSNY